MISVAFNVDTVHIVNQLYNNPDISSAISQLATQKIELIKEKCSAETAEPNCFEQNISDINDSQIRAFPIGWKSAKITSVNDLFLALLGWIVSAIAISQGVPFWFELLKEVVNVRDTGKLPLTFKEKMAKQDKKNN